MPSGATTPEEFAKLKRAAANDREVINLARADHILSCTGFLKLVNAGRRYPSRLADHFRRDVEGARGTRLHHHVSLDGLEAGASIRRGVFAGHQSEKTYPPSSLVTVSLVFRSVICDRHSCLVNNCALRILNGSTQGGYRWFGQTVCAHWQRLPGK